MKIFEKKSVIKIDGDDIKDARLSSAGFTDSATKKRAYMNVLGARLAMKMLFSQKIEANNLYSLYTIHSVLEELNISDVYYNSIRMDVRLVFDKNQIFVPKSHFEYGLTPDAYLVLQLKEDQSGAEFLGFFEPRDLDKKNANTDYYFYEAENLQKPENLKSFLDHFIVENNINEEGNEEAEALFLSFVDKEISAQDKSFLLKRLANSIVLREKIVEFENFEIISQRIAQTDELIQDGLLDIVGTQQLFEDEEKTTSKAEIKAEVIEEVLSGLLDEEEEEEEKDKNLLLTGETLAAGGLALAAGLELGSEAIKASSQAATAGIEAQADLIAGGVDVLSAGIGLGGQLTENIAKPSDESDLLTEIDDFLNQDDTSKEIKFENNTEFETFDLDSLDLDSLEIASPSEDGNIDIESIETESNEDNSFEIEEFSSELEDLDEFEGDIEEFTQIEEDTTDFENIETTTVEIPEISEIEDISPVEEIEDIESIENIEPEQEETPIELGTETEAIETTETDENVFNLDEFDFDMLNEDNESNESEAVSLDSLDSDEIPQKETIPPNEETEELDAVHKFQQLEEQEDSKEDSGQESDDFMSQVDDFLNDINLSDEQKNLLESELAAGIDLEDNTPTQTSAPKTELSPDDLFMDTDALLAQAEGSPGGDKDPLKLLFKEGDTEVKTDGINFDIKRIPNADLLKNKKVIIAASVAGAIFVSLAIGGIAIHNKNAAGSNKTAITEKVEAPTQNAPEDMTMDLNAPATEQVMPTGPQEIPAEEAQPKAQQKAEVGRDMGKAVSDAFMSEPVNANITKVAWEVPEDLAYNDSFRKYLQMAGKNLKLNLQNDLLLATEMAYSNKVVVDIEIGGNGNVNASNVVVSSGSKQIDKIVLQSIKNTLQYLKVPTSELGNKSVVATLIINF